MKRAPHGTDSDVKRRRATPPRPYAVKTYRGEPYRVRIALNRVTLAEHGYVTRLEAQRAAVRFAKAFEPEANVTVKVEGP